LLLGLVSTRFSFGLRSQGIFFGFCDCQVELHSHITPSQLSNPSTLHLPPPTTAILRVNALKAMGFKLAEVHETRLLGGRDSSPEKKSRKASFPLLDSKSKRRECTLDSVHKHGWKPLTLGAPVLFSFAFISFLLAIILEVLAQQSQKKGALALSDSPDDIPAFANFCYLFLPTIVAVIYSLLWSWIDLDVKRIQPWLEMSRSGGATAGRSLFLDYPYDFVAFVPLKAAKRRHWGVFYGGTVMVLIFWAITPLQSAIMGSGSVNIRRQAPTLSPSTIRPVSEHMDLMDQSVLNEGYALTWLNQQVPPFTTPEYAVLPFTAETNAPQKSSTNWTGSTTKYWTEINCRPANITMFGEKRRQTYDFVNGQGCNASSINPYGTFSPESPYKMMYIGFQNSAYVDYWLKSPSCSDSAFHQYLAIWSRYNKTIDDDIRLAASFCETSYFKQQVNITVSSTTQTPIEGSLVPLGPREHLSDTEFNITAFEYLMGAGVSPNEFGVTREHPFDHLLQQHPRVRSRGLTWPMSPMAGFAIGTQNATSLDQFRNEAFLAESFDAAHKMIFALAVRRVLTNTTSEAATEGMVEFEQYGIKISRVFSAVVEVLLAIVGIFTILLWWHSKIAPSKVTMDPASLGSIIGICQNSGTLLDDFAGKGCLPDDKLREAFEDKKFQLICGCQSRSGQMVIKVVDTRAEFYESQRISLETEPTLSIGHYSPIKPLALRREVGGLVTLIMMAAAAGLTYLKVLERRNNGIIRPDTSFEILQLLENFIPTVFATLLEPFWVLLNRLLCIIQPFKDLWHGRKTVKGSINARYTSVPPQLVLWRATKSGHFLLAALCVVALLSNLLAVGLGALFNELPIPVVSPRLYHHNLTPLMNNDTMNGFEDAIARNTFNYEDPSLVTMYNISQGTTLSAWTTKDYFFQPFTVVNDITSSGVTYTAPSRGFGIMPRCITAGTYKTYGMGPKLNETLMRDFEPIDGCPWPDEFSTWSSSWANYRTPSGPAAIEMVEVVNPFQGNCSKQLILGWGRSSQLQNTNNSEIDSTFVICRPVFTTAMFNVTVDHEGYILNSTQISDSKPTLDYPESTNHTNHIITLLNERLTYGPPSWHNDTVAGEWMNYLLKIETGNTRLQDPNGPLPNTTALIPSIENIYRRLFALVLGLNSDVFLPPPSPTAIQGTIRRTETRIFMDDSALIISLTVLAVNVLVATVVYGHSIIHFLPRMPTTVGSIIAYLAPSRAMREYTPAQEPDDDGKLQQQGTTFSFGRFVGDDGRAHIGIEIDPYVVPVQLKSLRRGDTLPPNSMLRRLLRRKGDARRGDTWL
ncbi:hypothetical protein CI238_06736, partial [Colletotrichum incanum]